MWSFIVIGLAVISKVYGYGHGNFPQVCGTMLPEHRFAPQTSSPPYEVYHQHENAGDRIKVCLKGKAGKEFQGFMLEALERDKEGGPPLGKFISNQPDINRLLTCGGSPVSNHPMLASSELLKTLIRFLVDACFTFLSPREDSAVSQRSNKRKTEICVDWTAPDADNARSNILFRATFLENYSTFWTKVDKNYIPLTTPRPSTQPSTALSTQPSTTTSPHPDTTTSTNPATTNPAASTTTPRANNTFYVLEKAGTVEMNVVIFLGVLKMELSNIFLTALFNGPLSRLLNKMSQIFFVAVCGAFEISSLVLFCLVDPINVTIVTLVSVAIGINFVELVIVCLPIGPSHELKEISEHAVKVFSFIHQIVTTAVIFVGILEIDKPKNHWTDSRILKLMLAFAVLLLLFEIWVFVRSTQGKAMLSRRKPGCSRNSERGRRRGKEKKLGAAEGIAIAVSVIFIVGILCFAVAVAVMILGCYQDQGCA